MLVGKKTWLCIYEILTLLSFRIVSVEHSCLGKVLSWRHKSCQVAYSVSAGVFKQLEKDLEADSLLQRGAGVQSRKGKWSCESSR